MRYNYNQNKKSNKGLIIALVATAIVFAVAVTTLGVMLSRANSKGKMTQMTLDSFYQESLHQMSESMSNIEVNMTKLMVSTSNIETAVLLNDTYRQSQAAITALNYLPISLEERRETDKFLNQLGDFCDTKAKEFMATDKSAAALAEEASAESFAIEAAADVAPSQISENETFPAKSSKNEKQNSFDDQIELLYARTKMLNNAVSRAAEKMDIFVDLPSLSTAGISASSDTTKKSSFEVPELIYDGPFSDGASAKSYRCVENMDELSSDDAAKKAAEVFEDIGLTNIKLIGETTTPDAYVFSGATDKSELFFSVTHKGGYVVFASMPCDNTGKKDTLGREQATEKAIDYAAMCGYKGLSPVWYTQAAGYAVVNLAPIEDGIVFYPDLVKVKVCLVNGDFKGIEAGGYCTCHVERNLGAGISQEQAAKAVSSKLSVKGVRLALIPKDQKERLCYEFSAEYKGLDYFVYIDANTGAQCNIMRVINSEQGSLVM